MKPTNYILKDRTYNTVEEYNGVEFECACCGANIKYVSASPKKIKYCYSCGKKIILRSAYETIEENYKKMA